ncbi:hypothetical protein LWI28_018190 [Acer negundo]|uniref:Uncharacterized protein n=1 Tax=Acer negundo TaxID=4023 RepID=A0AAD5JKB5_ACENE|nr:hypothetical protein LWI28_018190 [Acer negundo]
MVKAYGQNFLSLGFGTNGIGICVVDVSVGRYFFVPVLESCDDNFMLSPMETAMKKNVIKETTLKVLTLRDSLLKLMSTGRRLSLKQMIVSDLLRFGNPSQKLYSLLNEFARNERILRNMLLERDSFVIYGEFKDGVFVLHQLIPLQTLKLDEISVECVRNVLSKLVSKVNNLLSMEQCRQRKSAKWICNFGKKIGSGGGKDSNKKER